MEPVVLGHAIRWLLERIESFPIPIEEALWVYAYGSSDAWERAPGSEDVQDSPRRVVNSR